jgi:uncharacterized membrane protein SirB2
MYKGFLHTHYLVVTLFLVIYVIKTILLLSDKNELLQTFSKKIKLFEIIVSALFLITGVFLLTQLPFGSKYDYLLWIKIVMVFASIPLAVIGFKKGNKILAALSLLLITGSFGLAEVYHKRKNISTETVTGTDGKELYEANCKLCHGSDGKAMLAGALDLSITQLDKGGIKDVILNGRNLMVKVNVNEEQADAISNYVLENLKGK